MIADQVPPPPIDVMDVVVDHDGVTWRFGRRTDLAAGAGLALLASLFGALTLGRTPVGAWGGMASTVVALVALLVLVQALSSTTVRLTSRTLSIRSRAPWGGERQDVRIDDLVEARCARSDRGDLALVLRTHHETLVIGSRQPEDALRWMLWAVEHARARNAHREAEDGREWGFLRRAPEELARLRSEGDDL